MDGIDGVEIISSQLYGVNLNDFKSWLDENNFTLTSILANTFGSKKYKLGSITNTDPKIRSDALDICKNSIDLASELNCHMVNLWPGGDGFDYCYR